MKTAVAILAVLAAALIVCFLLAVIASALNEEPGPRCGTCAFFDRDLRICWKNSRLPNKQEYDRSCVEFEKKDEL